METKDSSNILKPPIIKKLNYDPSSLSLNGFIVTYQVIQMGIATVDLLTYYQGGLYGEYFDNAFLDGVPAITRLDYQIDFDWGLGLITNDVADFVSIRWSGKVYWEGTLVLDRWDSCCEDVAITLPMILGNFYDMHIEYKEYQEEAYVSMYWTSLSIPKQVIPPIYLYYPKRVGLSPYNITIL